MTIQRSSPDFYLLRVRFALLAWEEWLEVQKRDVLLLSVGNAISLADHHQGKNRTASATVLLIIPYSSLVGLDDPV
jgi:hypothetical protein